jgi:hypothetical protein
MTLFWFAWTISALVAAVVLFFFFTGLADGSVSSFNLLLWLVILAVTGSVVGGSLWLRSTGHTRAAIALTLLLTVPGLLLGLFFLILILAAPRWN